MYYTGIGSRTTPMEVRALMEQIGEALGRQGLILRSGGANGADTAFERGALQAGAQVQIFLPWRNFNGHTSPYDTPPANAYGLMATVHPKWTGLTTGAKHLHARNAQQVLGPELRIQTLTSLIICWTPDGADNERVQVSADTGGTGTAIRLAARYSIPVVNMKHAGWEMRLNQWLTEHNFTALEWLYD